MKNNTAVITKEFCKGKTLIFFPQTEEEAAFIQRKIFAMGYRWVEDPGTSVRHISESVNTGMVLDEKGFLWFNPSAKSLATGLLCTSDQFDEKYLSPDRTFMLEQFNKLSAKIDAVYEELRPPTLDKPIRSKPKSEFTL